MSPMRQEYTNSSIAWRIEYERLFLFAQISTEKGDSSDIVVQNWQFDPNEL
jgi:hypothetical protein